jgi:hypothetical protein
MAHRWIDEGKRSDQFRWFSSQLQIFMERNLQVFTIALARCNRWGVLPRLAGSKMMKFGLIHQLLVSQHRVAWGALDIKKFHTQRCAVLSRETKREPMNADRQISDDFLCPQIVFHVVTRNP